MDWAWVEAGGIARRVLVERCRQNASHKGSNQPRAACRSVLTTSGQDVSVVNFAVQKDTQITYNHERSIC